MTRRPPRSPPTGAPPAARPTRAAGGTVAPPADAVRLTAVQGPDAGASWSVATRAAVGTHERSDVRLTDDTVSRFHCELTVEERGVRIRDLESRNGTVVDGTRVLDGFLRDGSMLVLGATWLQVELGALRLTGLQLGDAPTRFGNLVGESPAMRAAFAAMERAAISDATVLLEGETGTGKEEAAAAIHQASRRADGSFVVVDCGAMPRELLLSELFGHEKGAFTGAADRRIGAFEEASGGTIFLDEIGELPLDLQPQLLRVLERREIRRLGSNRYVAVDVRVLAATNRDLRTEVNEERFRADLYYRLAVVTVRLPPLRERPGDLAALARTVLAGLGADAATIDRLCTPELVDTLRRGPWPGNVRELRNYLERCLVFDRALPLGGVGPGRTSTQAGDPARVDIDRPYAAARQDALDAFERAYVRALLARHDQNVPRAAVAAGLGRVQMWRLAKKHG